MTPPVADLQPDSCGDDSIPCPAYSRANAFRTPLAEKIFLDRYALKDTDKNRLQPGDLVVCSPTAEGGREIGVVAAVDPEGRTADVSPRDDPDARPVRAPADSLDKPLELHPHQMHRRVARTVAAVEPGAEAARLAEARFFAAMRDGAFVAGGRILAGAGVPGELTLYNCFVLPSPHDSRRGIMATAGLLFEVLSHGGGAGINVSSLRPRYEYVAGVHGRSSGAVSWAELYSFLTGRVEQGGSRRGALMLILDVWHPDVEEFIHAKRLPGRLDHANLSVAVSDDFMAAVERDAPWPLVFPDRSDPEYDSAWDGDLKKWLRAGRKVKTHRTVSARALYESICASAWASAEPGLFFVDQVNRLSNSAYYQEVRCTNPCGEQPLPPWGVCNLGALNLGVFSRPTPDGKRFWPTLESTADGAGELAALTEPPTGGQVPANCPRCGAEGGAGGGCVHCSACGFRDCERAPT